VEIIGDPEGINVHLAEDRDTSRRRGAIWAGGKLAGRFADLHELFPFFSIFERKRTSACAIAGIDAYYKASLLDIQYSPESL
jgi:hypothetical protein